MPSFQDAADQLAAGVAQPWGPGIGNQRHAFPSGKELEDFLRAAGFGVLVAAEQASGDNPIGFQQQSSSASILAGDNCDAAQDVECSQRDVPSVSNGGRNDVELICQYFWSPLHALAPAAVGKTGAEARRIPLPARHHGAGNGG